jgi:protein O-mannosyl-transferase
MKQKDRNIKSKSANPRSEKFKPKPVTLISKTDRYGMLFIFILAIVIYGNSYFNKYALDDLITIQQNSFTHQGFKGIKDILTNDYFAGAFGKDIKHLPGARYRPLSVITFAIEYQFFGMSPHTSHLINILLYALTGIIIYLVVSLILSHIPELKTQNQKIKTKWYLTIPFITSVLFIAHPVHTEIVSNIKGRDEIIAFLGSLIAMYYTIKYVDIKFKKYLLYSFTAMFLALMSKENAICFIVIIPLSVYLFRKVSLKKNLLSALPLFFAAMIFLLTRQLIVGNQESSTQTELMNNPFLYATTSQKYATIVYTLGLYIKLLLFPHPLTYDYYPYYINVMNWNDYRVIITLFIYTGLITYLIYGVNKILNNSSNNSLNKLPTNHYSILTFCVLFYILPLLLTSNLFFTIGVFMSERFIYMSSLGFCFAIAYGVYNLLFKVQISKFKVNYSLFAIRFSLFTVLILFSYKTIDRNRAWKDSLTLYLTDSKTSHNSAKSNYDAANTLSQSADTVKDISVKNYYYDLSIKYGLRAYKIHPVYADNLLTLGNDYFLYKKNLDSTVYYYKKQLVGFPDDSRPCNNIVHFLTTGNLDVNYQLKVFKEFLSLRPNDFDLNNNLGYIYGKYKNNPDSGIYYLSKAIEINDRMRLNSPNISDTYNNLGTWLYMKRDFNKAKEYFIKAIDLKPDIPLFNNNLGLAYNELGDISKAKECFDRANALQKR